MAHLMMIESWVFASGKLLPELLNKLGHTYTFVTRNPNLYNSYMYGGKHPVFQYAENVLEVDTNDTEMLIETLRNHKCDGVITVCDYYITTVATVAKALGLPNVFPSNINNVRLKHRMRQVLYKAGLPNPKFRLADNWEGIQQAITELGYPFVMKPVDLASSSFVRLIRTEEEAKKAYDALAEFPNNFRNQPRDTVVLMEEYMDGTEFSVESVSFNGKTTVLGITDKSLAGNPYFIESGHMFPADLPDDICDKMIDFVEKAISHLEFDNGIAHTEVKLTSKGPRIVEINPRVPGNYIVELIERVTGINLLNIFVNLSLGQKPELDKKDCDAKSAAVMFFIPTRQGTISHIEGENMLKENKNVARYLLDDCVGKNVTAATDNASYLGHVITVDKTGRHARSYAEQAVDMVSFHYRNEKE